MLKVGIHGSTGRTGQHVVELVKQDTSLLLSGCYSSNLSQDLDVFCKEADIVIDFSAALATRDLINAATIHNTSLVIGTTGLSQDIHQLINTAALNIPILYSTNMSYGITVLNKLLQLASALLSPTEYDVNILDKHHKFKKDSPSGTALTIDQIIHNAWSQSALSINNNFGDISHSSIKLGDITGEHHVNFANLDEQIILSHIAQNREIFAKGAIKAAKWLYNKPIGLYSMADIV